VTMASTTLPRHSGGNSGWTKFRQIFSRNKLSTEQMESKSSGPLIAAVFRALRTLMYGHVELPEHW